MKQDFRPLGSLTRGNIPGALVSVSLGVEDGSDHRPKAMQFCSIATEKNLTMRIPPLKAIIAFESIARTKSVNRAAEELDLTASAVSHQLSNLESMIGQSLFQRTGRGLVLTPTGERYLTDVTGSLADLSRATERASSQKEVDILRVHSSPSFGLMWLLPRLSSFQEANGDVQLNVACSYENVSFSNGYYDIDIRHGYGEWSNVEVRTVRGEFIAPLASPAYLARHPVKTPDDLLAQRLVYSETPLVQWRQWFGRVGVAGANKTFDFSFDRSYMSIETASLGLGIALESLMMASQKIKDGALVQVFDDSHSVEVGAHHLVYPHQNAELPRVAKFLTWIEEEIERCKVASQG